MSLRKNGSGKRVKKAAYHLLVWLILVCGATAFAEDGGIQATLSAQEWNWESNAICTLTGSLKAGNAALSGVTLTLETETEPETPDSARIVFTEVGGEKVRLRRQSSTFAVEQIEAGQEVPFQISWFLPEETLYEAAVRLRATGADGAEIALAEFSQVNEMASRNGPWRIPVDLNRLILILAITAGVVWAAALIRLALRRRMSMKQQ